MNHEHPIRHGTIGGYQAELRRGLKTCVTCKKAWRMYWQKKNGALPRHIDREKFEANKEKRRSGRDSRYDRKRGRDIGDLRWSIRAAKKKEEEENWTSTLDNQR